MGFNINKAMDTANKGWNHAVESCTTYVSNQAGKYSSMGNATKKGTVEKAMIVAAASFALGALFVSIPSAIILAAVVGIAKFSYTTNGYSTQDVFREGISDLRALSKQSPRVKRSSSFTG